MSDGEASEAEKAAREWVKQQVPTGGRGDYYNTQWTDGDMVAAVLAGVEWERKRFEEANRRFAKDFTYKIFGIGNKMRESEGE